MASLAELKQIQLNSTANPGGDPDAIPPVPPDPDIVDARNLLGRIEVAIWKEAEQIRAFPPARGTPEQNQANNEAIGWAQNAVDNSEALARKALKLLLVAHAADPAEGILALEDAEVEAAIDVIVPLFAKGSHPGQRR